MPIAGRIRMYTSGWPKYQKRCCQRSGSPPPDGLNQLVPSVRSKSSMATPDVRTGRASRSRIARSGERRGGEERRSRGAPDHLKKKKKKVVVNGIKDKIANQNTNIPMYRTAHIRLRRISNRLYKGTEVQCLITSK